MDDARQAFTKSNWDADEWAEYRAHPWWQRLMIDAVPYLPSFMLRMVFRKNLELTRDLPKALADREKVEAFARERKARFKADMEESDQLIKDINDGKFNTSDRK